MQKRLILAIISVAAICGAGAFIAKTIVDMNRSTLPAFTDKDFVNAASRLETRTTVAEPSVEPINASKRLRLAIGSIGMGADNQDQIIGDLTLAKLKDASGLELVERQALGKVLDELRLNLSGLVRAKDAVRAGKLLRVDWFLLGTPAVVNGTNVIVIRMVDAKTGIMRDASMISRDDNAQTVASNLAKFVRQSRQNAANPQPRNYLAIGTFEDLSVNNRRATIPTELRSYLTAVQKTNAVTMLEREFVSTLLNEIYLDLAGLTENLGTNTPTMQSAYWLVDGFYQTYETSQFEVEMVLNVRRMFGRSQRFSLREKPGEPLFRRVKATIDDVMSHNRAALVLTRVTEAQSQLSNGRELLDSIHKGMEHYLFSGWLNYTGQMPPDEVTRQRRNLDEAIRAFQSTLLLDATNRQAKASLADCLSTPFAGKFDEARDLYRQLIDAPVNDRWTGLAQRELSWSFERFISPAEKLRWFESAASTAANQPALDYFQSMARIASEDVTMRKVGTPEAQVVATERLFRDVQNWEKDVSRNMFLNDFHNTGLGKFAETFGTNSTAAARELVALLPRLQAASTNLAPHIFAGVITFQVDTNARIIRDFERSLESLSERLPSMVERHYYIELLNGQVYRWAEGKGLYRLAARLKEIHAQSAEFDNGIQVWDEDRIALAYNFLRAEEWQKALDVFQSYSNRPVVMGSSGLWGPAFSVVLTGNQAQLCRKKLGLPLVVDPREFDLGEPCLHPHSRQPYYDTLTFLADSEGLWVAPNNQLMRLNFDLQTNFIETVIPDNSSAITSLCAGTSNFWVGTAGAGIIELEKGSHKIHNFTDKDGMLMNDIASLHLDGDFLWIGYGNDSRGALGRLDLTSRRFTSFSTSIINRPGVTQPPANKVTRIQALPSGDVWFSAPTALFKFRPSENIWEEQPTVNNVWTRCYQIDGDRLIEGLRLPQVELTLEPIKPATSDTRKVKRLITAEESLLLQENLKTNGSGLRVSGSRFGLFSDAGELEIRTLADGKRRRLFADEKLPGPPTALVVHGQELWVGGQGFLALIDLEKNQIKKLSYITTRSVDSVQMGGGWLWVQFDKHIYRTKL